MTISTLHRQPETPSAPSTGSPGQSAPLLNFSPTGTDWPFMAWCSGRGSLLFVCHTLTCARRIFTERDLAPGPEIIFAACGVTDGNFMRGVRFFGHGMRTSSLLLSLSDRMIRFVDSVRLDGTPDVVVEF